MVLWASSFVVIRAVGTTYDAGSMALLRMIVGTAVLTLVVAMAGLVLGEGFSRRLVVGAPVSFLGVLIIGVSSSDTRLQLKGVLLALLAAVVYAAATLVQKHLLRRADAATLTWLGALTGTIALVPWGGQLVRDLAPAPLGAAMAIVYMGIFPTAVAFTTWAYVLSRSSAGATSATTYVVPAIALLMSWAFIGETPTAVMLAGGALCLVGVLIVRWLTRRSQQGDHQRDEQAGQQRRQTHRQTGEGALGGVVLQGTRGPDPVRDGTQGEPTHAVVADTQPVE